MLAGLLDENKQLRAMLQTVTNFVGEGIGGLTEKVGLKGHKDIDSFMEFVHQGDRQTLLRHYDTWKEQKAAAAGNDTVNMEDVDGDDRPTTKARNSNVKDAGRRSQPSSRASSPVNATSANNQDVGLSRKRSRTEKSVSGGASKSVQPATAQSSASATNSNSNATAEGKQESGGSAQASPVNANTAKTGFAPSPLSGNNLNTSSTASFPSLPSNNTQPPDYATYLSLMSAAQGPGNNVSNFTNPSFYSQMGGTSTGPTYNTFANSHFGANSAASGWNNSGMRPSGAQFDNSGNVGPASGGSNPFFFDTAEPMSMPTSSFTNEFLNQFIHTGLTPLIDPSYQNTLFPWSTNNVDSQQNAATPASSSSSINQLPSPVNQNHGNMNLTNMQNQQQQQQQQQQSGFVPQLSLGQTSLQQSQQPQQQRGQHQQPSVPPQLYNPLASPSSSLPSIPPGFSPDELINSNPLLAAIHIISL